MANEIPEPAELLRKIAAEWTKGMTLSFPEVLAQDIRRNYQLAKPGSRGRLEILGQIVSLCESSTRRQGP